MSSTLKWRPNVPIEGHCLTDALKYRLSRRLWGTDGSCGDGNATMTEEDIPYVEGLRDAGVKGAQELIDILYKHGSIILWHEH